MSGNPNVDHSAAAHRQPRCRRAVLISVLFHGVLIVILLLWYVPLRRGSGDSEAIVASAPAASFENAHPSSSSPPHGTTAPVAEPNPEIPPEQIQASIEAQIQRVEKLSDERKLVELEKNLQRLESLSTEASVREVTATIAGSLGLQPGAVPQQGANSGPFDADTAQLHDVIRNRHDSGSWDYESVLVDAEGRTRSVPMTQAEGETAYKAFEKMKQFPMAAGIYRQVVMPMIQKMIEAGRVAEQAAAEAERMQRDAPGSPRESSES